MKVDRRQLQKNGATGLDRHSACDHPEGPPRPWWHEWEIAVIISVVLIGYFSRLDTLPLRGEESRRAQVAVEILQTGDWIVPHEQGDPYFSRPPLQNWLIALSRLAFGSQRAWVMRLPSALAMLLMTVLVYGYARTGLGRVAALAAAVAFASFGEMFTIGAQAETEMVFIVLVSSSVLLWHWGQIRNWPAVWAWTSGYGCMGFAVLCKGAFQPPIYFLAPVTIYLVLTRQWRWLFSRAHVAGAAVGAGVVLAWLLPFVGRMGWEAGWVILFRNTTARLEGWRLPDICRHLFTFPLELVGCTLPWSPLLLAYTSPWLWQSLGAVRSHVRLLLVCLLVAVPTVWLPPGGATRYVSPVYPFLAILTGVVVQGVLCAALPAAVRRGWSVYTKGISGLMVMAALAAPLAALFLLGHQCLWVWAEPPAVALCYGVTSAVLAIVVLRGRHGGDAGRVRGTVLAVAAFTLLSCNGLLTNVRWRRSENPAPAVARLKELLPLGERLVSFGHIDSSFAYFYARPIEPLVFRTDCAYSVTEGGYFCFDSDRGWRPPLPFPWEEVAAIPMDRNHSVPPVRTLVVGRRMGGNR